MAHKDSPSLDHIDPLWEEGRDYQLVCGRDCERNWREVTYSHNSAKGVRFLPWRYASDEIGVKPVETGDWCQFYNPFTQDWELMEFEGERWWELSKMYDARHHNMTKISSDILAMRTEEGKKQGGYVAGRIAAERGFFDLNSPNCIKTFETLSAAGKVGGKIAGAKCRDEGIGWCGADKETQREWKRAGGRASKGMLYWNDGTKNKRAKECPGDGWIRGRIKTWS
jgi:hypothetical protein